MLKNSLNFGGHSKMKNTNSDVYKLFIEELNFKLKEGRERGENEIKVNVPFKTIDQEEFNTVGNHPSINKNNPNMPTEQKIEQEHGLPKRGPYNGGLN